MMQRVLYYHRLQCVKDECICNHYYELIVDNFKEVTCAKVKDNHIQEVSSENESGISEEEEK